MDGDLQWKRTFDEKQCTMKEQKMSFDEKQPSLEDDKPQ